MRTLTGGTVTERGYTRLVNGNLLKELRERALLTQDELAAASGVSRATIIRYEQGRGRHPSPLRVRKLAHTLGADIHDLVTLTFD